MMNSKTAEYIRQSKPVTYPLAAGVAIIVIWENVTTIFNVSNLLLPPPTAIYQEYRSLQELVNSNLLSTVSVAATGFLSAFVLSFLLAIIMTLSEKIEETLMPFIVALNTTPRIALSPLILFYFGGSYAKFLIATWVALFPMLVNIQEGLKESDEDISMLFESIGASRWQVLKKHRLPNSIPFLFDGLKIGVILAVVGSIVGEYVASDTGAGYLALVALSQYNVALMFTVAIIMGFIALVSFYGFHLLQSRLVYWKDTSLFSEESQ